MVNRGSNSDEFIMATGRSKVELKNRAVTVVTEGRKRNPNSLRFLIAHIVQMYFDSNRSIAAEEMAKAKGQYRSEKNPEELKKMNYDALSEILRDDKHIAYWQLEEFSKVVDFPVGALLLISRWYALRQKNDRLASSAFVEAIAGFAEIMKDIDQRGGFSRRDFAKIAKHFSKASEQSPYFPFNPPADKSEK